VGAFEGELRRPMVGNRLMNVKVQIANDPMRSLAIAGSGAILAAVGTMFLPIALLEGIIGATGLSELFPSVAAPLGDTARAMIAFATGILGFALIALWQSRKSAKAEHDVTSSARASMAAEPENFTKTDDDMHIGSAVSGTLFGKVRATLGSLTARARGADADGEPNDILKLRTRDIHPDAPARRPLHANRDLADIDARRPEPYIPEVALPAASPLLSKPRPLVLEPEAVAAVEPVTEVIPVVEVTAVADPAPVTHSESTSNTDSLAGMVESLELALAVRQAQLERLESFARRVTEEVAIVREPTSMDANVAPTAPTAPTAPAVMPEVSAPESMFAVDVEPVLERRLEAVQPTGSAIAQPRNGDEALRSALETLHRMNARSH
jgi:hypothetical protein